MVSSKRATVKPDAATLPSVSPAEQAEALLAWYDRARRSLPWRASPGLRADPYHVWLSEVMLQQTTVAAVEPYFHRFLAAWPTVADLAAADPDAVLAAWAGLGYYARARNLIACARAVAGGLGGRFPEDETGLRALPGVGAYTAAAIAAIAFEQPATVVDGNVERVVARLFAVMTPLPAARPALKALAVTLTPAVRPGDYAQAMMDLGATVCTPRRPLCLTCPLRAGCAATAAGIAEELPQRAEKGEKPVRRGVAFWLTDGTGAVLLRRRPPRGLLGGMLGLPGTAWQPGAAPDARAIADAAPVRLEWQPVPGLVRHTLTHFHLELTVLGGRLAGRPWAADPADLWVPGAELEAQGLPTVMRKAVRLALAWMGGQAV